MIQKNLLLSKNMILIALVAMSLVMVSCAQPQSTDATQNEKLTVAATFFPIYDLTRSITQDHATVHSMVPAGVELHTYEPSSGDMLKAQQADVFVALGVEFGIHEDDILETLSDSVTVVKAAQGIELFDSPEEHDDHDEHDEDEHADEHHEEGHDDHDEHDEDEHADEHHEEGHDDHEEDHHGHHHPEKDPHVWLSPKNAQAMVSVITQGLIQADPANINAYNENSQNLMLDLQALDQEFQEGLASCAKDTVLVNHNAFAYLAQEYNFNVVAINGLEPESEPTPKQLAALIDEAREHDIKYVFYEEIVDPRVANTIAAEIGAQTLLLHPLEGITEDSETYLSLMRQNLENLQVALECTS